MLGFICQQYILIKKKEHSIEFEELKPKESWMK